MLVTLVTSTALVPLTAPLFASAFFGDALKLSPAALGLKLLAILVGALTVAVLIRRIFGVPAINKQKGPIDGFNILILFVFVSAVMGNVAGGILANPLQMLKFALTAFAVFFALLGLTTLIFRRTRPRTRVCPWPDGFTTQYGVDGGRDGRCSARAYLVVFRAISVPYLPVTPVAETDCAKIQCTTFARDRIEAK